MATPANLLVYFGNVAGNLGAAGVDADENGYITPREITSEELTAILNENQPVPDATVQPGEGIEVISEMPVIVVPLAQCLAKERKAAGQIIWL